MIFRKKLMFILVSSLTSIWLLDSGVGFGENGDVSRCGIKLNKTLEFVEKRINSSSQTSKMLLSCDDLSRINKWREEEITVTTGRANGKYTICISNDINSPCEYIISTFNSSGIPADMLNDVFGVKTVNRSHLNETVERLFLKPSKLITR